MPLSAVPSLEGRLYRAALCLCPDGFRREHGDEMARDFDEARGEAAAAGGPALWSFRFLVAVDLARTFGSQWLRTSAPVIAFASILFSLTLAEGFATLARRVTAFQIPDDPAHAEMVAVLLVAVTCVMLIAMTIVLTVSVNRPRRRGRR
jgi:hypothetical protein